MSSIPTDPDLELLRLDYELYRQYEAQTQQQNFSLMASILAASGVIVLAFFENTATLVFLFMPVIPLMLIGYTILTYATMAVASYYGRALERALFAKVRHAVDLSTGELRSQADTNDLSSGQLLPVPSLGHLTQMAVSNRGEVLASRVVATFGLGFYALAALAPVVITVLRLPSWGWRVAGIALYTPVLSAALAAGWYVAAAPERIWARLLERLHIRWNRPLDPGGITTSAVRRLPPGPPHLVTLLLPRPFEFAFKGCMVGGAAVVLGALAIGELTLQAFGWYIAFELLLYQARYQVNDAIGAAADAVDPERSWRMRLRTFTNPTGPEVRRNRIRVRSMYFVAAVRVIAWCALLATQGGPVPGVLWSATGVVALAAVLYETARSRPSGPGPTVSTAVANRATADATIIATVGAGYGARVAAGFALGAAGGASEWLLCLGFIGFSVGGALSVVLSWAAQLGKYLPAAAPVPAPNIDHRVTHHPHLLRIGLWSDALADTSTLDVDLIDDPHGRPSLRRSPLSTYADPATPTMMLFTGLVVLGMVPFALGLGHQAHRFNVTVVAALLCAGSAGITAALRKSPPVLILTSTIVTLTSWIGAAIVAGTIWALVPMVLVVGSVTFYRAASSMSLTPEPVVDALVRGARTVRAVLNEVVR